MNEEEPEDKIHRGYNPKKLIIEKDKKSNISRITHDTFDYSIYNKKKNLDEYVLGVPKVSSEYKLSSEDEINFDIYKKYKNILNIKHVNPSIPIKQEINKYFTQLKFNNKINFGSFGVIYDGFYNNEHVAIKIAKIKYDSDISDYEDFLLNINKEIVFYKHLSELNLAPKYYNGAIFKRGDIYSFYLVIISELMKPIDITPKSNITADLHELMTKMVEIIYEIIYIHKIYCLDIKPLNFLQSMDGTYVRMIDFGEYCSEHIGRPLSKREKNMYFIAAIYQLMVFSPEKYHQKFMAFLKTFIQNNNNIQLEIAYFNKKTLEKEYFQELLKILLYYINSFYPSFNYKGIDIINELNTFINIISSDKSVFFGKRSRKRRK